MSNDEGGAYVDAIQSAETPSDVMGEWTKAINAAKKLDPIDYRAMTLFTEARDERLKALKKGAK